MKSRLGRIAIVTPYKELYDLAHEVCKALAPDVLIGIGDLEEGLKKAQEFINRGAEVIISRGGTATLIEEKLDIPVVQIAVSGFDLVRAVAEARNFGHRIGVVGFPNVIYGSKSLAPVLGVSIEEIEISHSEEVPAAVQNALKSGIQVVVGDAISVRYSNELGMHAILVDSGKEALGLALREANELAIVRRKERTRSEQLKVILDSTYEGIIATDTDGRISLVNQAAEKTLELDASRLLGQPVGEALPGYPIEQVHQSGEKRIGNLYRAGKNLIVQNIVPVRVDEETVGVVATFQDAGHLQAVETKVRQKIYLKGHVAHFTFSDIVTQSPKMARTIDQAKRFANSEATILVNGETGTGKEMFAQSIHNLSQRKEHPFVAINCAAVPETLLESELFGYEEGAFTGAKKGGKRGLFELAHRGTLFLDEVGELSLNLQARLLRVLQQKVIMRVGGDQMIPIDVRVIAATHRNLEEDIEHGNFRRDFFYRLNVLHLEIPPLRERLEDLPLLINVLMEKFKLKSGFNAPVISDEAITKLKCYAWPGNVRELENILERLVVLQSGEAVDLEFVEEMLGACNLTNGENELQLKLSGTLDDMERMIIQKMLELTHYDKDETCRRLGLSKTTLWRRLKEN